MEYAKCLVELNEILGHLEKEYLDKIPQDVRNGITEKMDKHYNWKCDESKELEEQNIDRKTIAMLSYLNMEYLLDDEQRKLMEEIHKVNEMKAKEKMRAKANNSLNRIKEEKSEKVELNDENVALVKTAHPKWYEKILSFVKNAFKK